MACNRKPKDEVVVCNTLFKYDLVEEPATNSVSLVCTPCCLPTAVYDVARISTRSNSCSGLDYYQAFINTDPVEIIQDCSLENIVVRCLEIYFENAPCPECNGRSSCNNRLFGF